MSAVEESIEQLFAAKWNIPTAAQHCGLTNNEMKEAFNKHCNLTPATWTE